MNKKVFISMLSLVISFLIGIYVLKIFFPEEFMMSIQNEQLVAIGKFIDSHIVITHICTAITSFITYWIYCCACCKRMYLKWYQVLMILGVVALVKTLNIYDSSLGSIVSWCSFVFLPALMGGDIKTTAIVFTTHSVAQGLSIKIRSLPLYLKSINSMTAILMTAESYFWLLLMFIIFNYKKKEE